MSGFQVNCSECDSPAIAAYGTKPVVRAWVVCPECVEKIPEALFEKVIEVIKKGNK